MVTNGDTGLFGHVSRSRRCDIFDGPSGPSGEETDASPSSSKQTAHLPTRLRSPLWRPGDTIPLGYKTLRVIDVPDGDMDEDPVLVVEDVSE
jgi:hypothetical protein